MLVNGQSEKFLEFADPFASFVENKDFLENDFRPWDRIDFIEFYLPD